MKKRNNFFEEILKSENAAFVLDENKFIENIKRISNAFKTYYPKVKIGYSYKTNYVTRICKLAHANSCWAEVVSDMEVDFAFNNLGQEKTKIIYNGPVKSYNSLEKVINNGGIINVDNFQDIEKIDQILSKNSLQKKAKVAIRLSFDYENNKSRFGFDLEDVLELERKLLDNNKYEVLGFHLHLPFRDLITYEYRMKCIFEVLKKSRNENISYINLGGGFFGHLSDEIAKSLGMEKSPTYDDYANIVAKQLNSFFLENGVSSSDMPTLVIEPGSSVVADVMYFITKIHAKKTINNRNYLVTYAGRHLLSPTNKTVSLPLEIVSESESTTEHIVAGYTCIEGDILGTIAAPKTIDLNTDYIIVSNVGSYSIVMGSDFILPQPAIYSINNDLLILRKARTSHDVYNQFL